MARNNSGRPLCRYFASGCCTRDDCGFQHDRSARPDNVCRFYLSGQCFYGDECRYDHISADRIRQQDSSRPNDDDKSKLPRVGGVPKPRFPAARLGGENASSQAVLDEPYVAPSSYAQAVDKTSFGAYVLDENYPMHSTFQELCQYAMTGICPIGDECAYFHGDVCDICHCQVLDPVDETQRACHEKLCSEAMERDMEFSFAVQRSEEKTCSICMDNVLDKVAVEKQRFGILENCGHTFCFECIMNWRKQSKETVDSKTLQSCPECRVHSNYVIPSKLWPETKHDRDNVIKEYKKAMGRKHCRHFDQGRGRCPFGGSCFFLHALPDGTRVALPAPKPKRKVLGADFANLFLSSLQLSDFLNFSDDEDDVGGDEDRDTFDDIYNADDWASSNEDDDAHNGNEDAQSRRSPTDLVAMMNMIAGLGRGLLEIEAQEVRLRDAALGTDAAATAESSLEGHRPPVAPPVSLTPHVPPTRQTERLERRRPAASAPGAAQSAGGDSASSTQPPPAAVAGPKDDTNDGWVAVQPRRMRRNCGGQTGDY